jgi:hypothetical protein
VAVGPVQPAGEHQVGPPGLQFVARQLHRVQAARTRGVQREGAPAEAERLRQQPGRQPGDVAVERVNRDVLAGQVLPGEVVRLLRRQADVAEDDAGLAAVGVRRLRGPPRPPADVEYQVKERVELLHQPAGDVQPGQVRGEVVEEVAAGVRHGVGVRDARVDAPVRWQHPPAGRHLAGAVGGGGHVPPEEVGVGAAAGEADGEPDDGDWLGGRHQRTQWEAGIL